MPLIVPPGYSQVSFIHGNQSPLGSKPVWSIGISAPPTELYLDGFQAWWESDYQPLMDGSLILERITMTNEVASLERTVGLAGGGVGTYVAPQVTALIKKVTGLAGRANRGRMNWPGVLPETSIDQGGTIAPARVTSIQGTADTLMDLATTTGDELVLFHTASSDPTIIAQLVCASQSATLRRRNRK